LSPTEQAQARRWILAKRGTIAAGRGKINRKKEEERHRGAKGERLKAGG